MVHNKKRTKQEECNVERRNRSNKGDGGWYQPCLSLDSMEKNLSDSVSVCEEKKKREDGMSKRKKRERD